LFGCGHSLAWASEIENKWEVEVQKLFSSNLRGNEEVEKRTLK